MPGTNLANKDSLEEKSDKYGLYVLVVIREAINKQTLWPSLSKSETVGKE